MKSDVKRHPVLSVIETTHTVSLIEGMDQYIFMLPVDKASSIGKAMSAIDRYTEMSADKNGWIKKTELKYSAPAVMSLTFCLLIYCILYLTATGQVPGYLRTHIAILAPVLIMASFTSFVAYLAKVLNARSEWKSVTSKRPAEYVASEAGWSWLSYTDLLLAESIRLDDMSSDNKRNSIAAQKYAGWLRHHREGVAS